MVEMSCEEHDRQAASTQFITHTVGRVLGAMELQATPIDTRYSSCAFIHCWCIELSRTPCIMCGPQTLHLVWHKYARSDVAGRFSVARVITCLLCIANPWIVQNTHWRRASPPLLLFMLVCMVVSVSIPDALQLCANC
jgi:hypothetical protein